MSWIALPRLLRRAWVRVAALVSYSRYSYVSPVEGSDLTWLAATFKQWPSEGDYVDVYLWGPDMRTISAPSYHPPLIRFFPSSRIYKEAWLARRAELIGEGTNE